MLAGGGPPESCRPACSNGNFVRPTVLADVDNRMRIAQEEIFGPVACLIPFKDEAEALALANDVKLRPRVVRLDAGHSAGRIGWPRGIEAGMVFVNSQNVRDLRQPFGGIKESGIGREGGECELRDVLRSEERLRVARAGIRFRAGDACTLLRSLPPRGASLLGRPAEADMGKLALAAKITHVPSMYLSELPGKHHGCRRGGDRRASRDRPALPGARRRHDRRARRPLAGQRRLPRQLLRALQGRLHQQRAAALHQGHGATTTRAIRRLGRLIADTATAHGVLTRAHTMRQRSELEYGTLVPMRYMNADRHFKVVSVAAWCNWHTLEDSRRFGEAVREAIERSDGTVAVLASGSLSHRFNDNGSPEESIHQISASSTARSTCASSTCGSAGDFKDFCAMLPEYAEACQGEGKMHDTAMLLGMLGWDAYDEPVEIVTDYFASSGTGQINAIFPVPRRDGAA